MWFVSHWILANNAFAYDPQPWGVRVSGNQVVFAMDPDTLGPNTRSTIVAAARAWDAGSGELLRGADWRTTIVTLPPGTSVGLNNGRNEIYMRDEAWFEDHDSAGKLAVHFKRQLDRDIVFNSSLSWCATASPSENPNCRGGNNPISIGQAFVHELGHLFFTDEEDTVIATMNPFFPAGGDVGEAKWGIHEDDFRGLMDLKPGTSTGFNVAVGEYGPGSGGQAVIMWEGSKTWDKSDNAWVNGPPQPPQLIYNGTGSASVPVHWRLSSNDFCSTSDYLIGTRTPGMSTNSPYAVNPDTWTVPSNIPTGSYYYCVLVDPNITLDETTRSDNTVVSLNPYVTVRN